MLGAVNIGFLHLNLDPALGPTSTLDLQVTTNLSRKAILLKKFFVFSDEVVATATTRASEAGIIRSDADALGDGENIIYVGDFNMFGSSEGAWVTLGMAKPLTLQSHQESGETMRHSPAFTRRTQVPPWMTVSI